MPCAGKSQHLLQCAADKNFLLNSTGRNLLDFLDSMDSGSCFYLYRYTINFQLIQNEYSQYFLFACQTKKLLLFSK